MRVYEGSAALGDAARGCVLTIGNFDGVHLGHQALIDAVVRRARELGRTTGLYTFHPHPRRVLDPGGNHPPQLMIWEQLEHELELRGIDLLIRELFTQEFASRSPQEFLSDVLRARIGPAEVFVGRDFHFGRGRAGSGESLARMAPSEGMRVEIIDQVSVGGIDVSSTWIREALAAGEVGEAGRALGRPYEIWGSVVGGDRRGRQLGFPTANLDTANELVPAHGVYATRVHRFKGNVPGPEGHDSVTNVGTRPTFEPGRMLAETHLIDFHGDLYGERIALAFHERIRAEQRFAGADELRAQIARDVARAREIHAASGR
jgi:riboflavin kinase/FMN adenylyltransferase